MEGITPQAMLATIKYSTSNISQYNDTHVYLYSLMSIHRGLCQLPLIIIFMISFNYLVGLYITHQLQGGPYPMIMDTLHK
jgi:hypothetical protein